MHFTIKFIQIRKNLFTINLNKYLDINMFLVSVESSHKIHEWDIMYQDILYQELLDIKIFCIKKCKYLLAESGEQNKQESKTESKHGVRHGACQI